MRLAEAKKLVEYFAIGGKGELLVTNSTTRLLNLIGQSVKALELGVSRAHIVAPVSGALLQELYTLDGAGTLISRDLYDGIRLAMPEDTPGILEMIRPLEAQGVLVQRDEQEVCGGPRRRDAATQCDAPQLSHAAPPPTHGRPQVLRDVYRGFYYVYTRDSALLATAMLKRFSPTSAELGCLVVDPAYRKQGRGDAMLSFIERTAIAAGVTEIFALSTRTMQWCEPAASRPGSAPRTARRPPLTAAAAAAAAPRAQVCRARLQERAARRIARAPAEALPARAQLEGVPQGPRAGRPRRRRRGALLGAGRRRVVQLSRAESRLGRRLVRRRCHRGAVAARLGR